MLVPATSAFNVRELAAPRASAADIEIFCVTFDFRVTLDCPAFAPLSDDERAKVARFRRHDDALRYAMTRVALRQLLAERTDLKASELRFERDTGGRPRLHKSMQSGPGGQLDFNVSHSEQYALIAIGRQRRVGVDIEFARKDMNWRKLTSAVFAPRDEAHVTALPMHKRADAFYDVWTAKEAMLKALGAGIGGGMTWFSVLGDRQHEPRIVVSEESVRDRDVIANLDAVWLRALSGYAACVAWSRDAAWWDA
ncbi:4'-phosphopantetheinyl transferase superfamily protein [Paraburkholderia sp. EG286B]|uniref:4'-phosphopantetheinyl transferase superfamily protein n=1 Tax=Paraburkholderia sp. EG286B TaxID=3237011 RepID=UPI0034D1C4C3